MPDTSPVVTLSPRDYDAILFDLDGVLTRTARVHAAAWKRLFDQFLEQQPVETGESFVPFEIADLFHVRVDGLDIARLALIGSAIAYNVWQYFQVTQDLEFLECYGAELILE